MQKAEKARRVALQRGLGLALWRQVADGIRNGIGSGLADKTGRLPSEAELALRFGVNRHTVRAAIAALTHEGVLQAHQGRGTFIRSHNRLVYPIGDRTRFSAGFEGQATDVHTEMLGHSRETPPPDIASALDMGHDEEALLLELIGMADGVPISRGTAWFNPSRYPTIVDAYRQAGSITAALLGLGVEDYVRASTVVEARHADQADTAALRLAPGGIVIVTRALNVTRSGEPVHYSVTRFAADRVQLLMQGTVSGGHGLDAR